ncbi:MAG: BlaI/MecI/CopY family transcriptional regulator [Pseudomonadota bacterium]|nr:BlaI/MecI/CopY family transcriptional regulator [Pseudomonadota bacterium]
MGKPLQITDAEWELMKALWATPGSTASEVLDKVSRDWHLKTVRTLLDRLQKKGAVSASAERPCRYFPLVTREECIEAASSSFLDKVFDGALTPLVAHFVKQSPISQKDKAELERILAKYRNGGKT